MAVVPALPFQHTRVLTWEEGGVGAGWVVGWGWGLNGAVIKTDRDLFRGAIVNVSLALSGRHKRWDISFVSFQAFFVFVFVLFKKIFFFY